MKRIKSTYKTFGVDIYKRGVLVFFGAKEELYKVAKGSLTQQSIQELEIINFDCTQAVCIRTETDAIIYAPKRPYDEVIAHELSHATFHILKKVDIDPTISEEAYTYLFEYLYYKVFLWLNSLEQDDIFHTEKHN